MHDGEKFILRQFTLCLCVCVAFSSITVAWTNGSMLIQNGRSLHTQHTHTHNGIEHNTFITFQRRMYLNLVSLQTDRVMANYIYYRDDEEKDKEAKIESVV